jgi:hypothetical protein
MTNAQWALVALFAAALPACATAHGAPSADGTSSLRHARAEAAHTSRAAGRAAQPGSWETGAASDALSFTAQGPRGQAAQPSSWITPNASPAPTVATPLADEGPSYLGGRAAQPYSWLPESAPAHDRHQVAGL